MLIRKPKSNRIVLNCFYSTFHCQTFPIGLNKREKGAAFFVSKVKTQIKNVSNILMFCLVIRFGKIKVF